MPKKTRPPAPIRQELIEPLTELLRDRSRVIQDWPADEAAAYRDIGGFVEGRNAVQKLRMAKAAAAIEEVFAGVVSASELKGYLDETYRSILDKEGLTSIDLDGGPIR